jgi:hypothetical protein
MEGDWPEDAEIDRPEDTAIKRLLRAARQVASRFIIANDDEGELAGEFEQAIDDVESFFEKDDPQSNGWVGGNGLP